MLLLVLLLVSCGVGDLTDIPLEPLDVPLADADPATYSVIAASDCSAECRALAQTLVDAIGAQTGGTAQFYYQHEAPSASREGIVIYLGWIADVEAVSGALRTLRRDDYLCRRTGNTVILGGRTDGATRTAVERFCREILPAATAERLMSEEGGFLYRGADYGASSVKLNGFDLWEYCIVYPKKGAEELQSLALALRDEIADRSGYVLEVTSDSGAGAMSRGIFVGTEPPDQEGSCAYLIPKSNGVLLCAEDFFGVSVAAERLCAYLLTGSDQGEHSWTLSVDEAFEYAHRSYSLLSMTGQGSGLSSPEQIQRLLDPVLTHQPDAVWFGAVEEERVTYLTQGLQGYTPLGGSTADWVCGREGVLSGQTECFVSKAGVTVLSHWVGDEWNGFRALRISGELTEEQVMAAGELAALMTDEPTVILIHTTGAALTVDSAMPSDLCAVLAEQIATEEAGFFA